MHRVRILALRRIRKLQKFRHVLLPLSARHREVKAKAVRSRAMHREKGEDGWREMNFRNVCKD